jgi:Rps23 Pro-64 3,4-dihydroxylase Tpa1-like proline 4-hydroxylase
MIIDRFADGFEALYIEDTFTEEQIAAIWKELDFVTNPYAMKNWENTKEKLGEDLEVEKKNNVFYPTLQYQNPILISPMTAFTKQQLCSEYVFTFYESLNPVHELYRHQNVHTTFVSYYQDADKYDYHRDNCCYTTLTYLYKEPKSFSGGEITIKVHDIEETKEIKNNMSIIFPSVYRHRVSPITMSDEFGQYSTYGRYCISQFTYLNKN